MHPRFVLIFLALIFGISLFFTAIRKDQVMVNDDVYMGIQQVHLEPTTESLGDILARSPGQGMELVALGFLPLLVSLLTIFFQPRLSGALGALLGIFLFAAFSLIIGSFFIVYGNWLLSGKHYAPGGRMLLGAGLFTILFCMASLISKGFREKLYYSE